MYTKNKSGPRTDPRGTPKKTQEGVTHLTFGGLFIQTLVNLKEFSVIHRIKCLSIIT